MKKFVTASALTFGLALACLSSPAFAGSPHFVGTPTATISGNTVTVDGKEAGLGDELQIHIEVTGDAACVNPGGNKPQAGNKESFAAAGDFPVQNGKADFSLDLVATFQPECVPPMSVQWSNIVVTDAANGLTATL